MSALTNAEISRVSNLRLDGVQDRKNAAGAQERVAAAESFGALLQMVSSSTGGSSNAQDSLDAASASQPVDRPVSAGMASLIAQGGLDSLTGGQGGDDQTAAGFGGAAAAGTTGSDTVTLAPNADFRWMATLIAAQEQA